MKYSLIRLFMLFITIFLVACTKAPAVVNVGYQPPLVPVRISIDSNGELQVSWEGSIQTPIGTFSAGVSVDPSQIFPDAKSTLTVRVNGQDTIYDVGERNIEIQLESGYYKQIELRKMGTNWFFEVVRIAESTQAISTQPASQPQPSSRPPSIHLRTGETQMVSDGWIWVCTGDFAVTAPDGRKLHPYDQGVSSTGLILVLEANSRATLSGPDNMPNGIVIGDCHPVTQEEKNAKVSWAISEQLSHGCGSSCTSVRIVEFDANLDIITDYWKP